MLSPWLNNIVKIERRNSNPARNSLNEPNYGNENTWPIVYNNINVRIEYEPEQMQFLPTGERVNPSASNFFMYVEDGVNVNPEDRVTVTSSDDPTLVGRYYVVTAVFTEWDSMGNRHHSMVQMQVH